MLTVTGVEKSKKKLALAIAACTLLLTLAFGGTLAYFTDAEGTANIVTVGRVHIELEEPGYPGNDSDEGELPATYARHTAPGSGGFGSVEPLFSCLRGVKFTG